MTSQPRRGALAGLALAALGVVFGDIGTSPLYSMQTVFSIDHNDVHATAPDVFGVISMAFWSITLVVTCKYVLFVMRADNDGEGGIIALAALARRAVGQRSGLAGSALMLGIVGASLFYGDSVITPAISVMSAVEGLSVVDPGLARYSVPVSFVILTALFAAQRYGTQRIGRVFGPVMVLWFLAIAALGIPQIAAHPQILKALSPTYAAAFMLDRPFVAFVAAGAVVLTVTGAEALYADMGHFGTRPIRLAWFALAFPALTLNYLGQGALILSHPANVSNPFYLMAPGSLRLPLVVLATMATVIASQAVISGAYSMSQQATRLGLLPRLTVRHTSADETGQIYVPVINALLYIAVIVLLVTFRSSSRLATAYGVAVTGTFVLTTVLLVVVARRAWHWPRRRLIALAVVFGGTELGYFLANLAKIFSGGWIPLVIALAVITVMTTWRTGGNLIIERRRRLEGPFDAFLRGLHQAGSDVVEVPGTAVYLHINPVSVPLALRVNVDTNHVLHHRVVIATVLTDNAPHVPFDERLSLDGAYLDDRLQLVTLRFGFMDTHNVPEALARNVEGSPQLALDRRSLVYFLSRINIQPGRGGLTAWRKRLFVALARNAADPVPFFRLPAHRVVVTGQVVEL